ncbi:MAG: M24 family metallopeptidase, partial [Candidatus Angelobacter sp.]
MNSRLHDDERIASIQRSLGEHNLDALLVSLPRHVLMLTGYYPVVGTSLAICTREGQVGLLAPEDEKQFAQRAGADQSEYFKPVTLDEILPLGECVVRPMQRLAAKLELKPGRIGMESGPASEPSSYSALNFYGPALREVAGEVWPSAEFSDAQRMLRQLCAVKTQNELRHIRTACSVAAAGFESGRTEITSGISEMQLAARFSADFAAAAASAGIDRQHAFVYCMSGPNSAHAYYAYAHSTARNLSWRDWALVHCNSHAGGYWTDITRTYVMGEHTEPHREMFQAVLEARDAALAAIHP